MWRLRPPAAPQPTRAAIKRPIVEPTSSLSRPYVLLQVSFVHGRGFVLALTDSTTREVVTPTMTAETLARALEGRNVTLRHAGHSVEMVAATGCVRIKAGPVGIPPIEATFDSEDLERAMRLAMERHN